MLGPLSTSPAGGSSQHVVPFVGRLRYNIIMTTTSRRAITFKSPGDRRAFVVRQRSANPQRTFEEIGDMLGITPQRAMQLHAMHFYYASRGTPRGTDS